MNNYTVYIHTNNENGLKYVGITSRQPEARWRGGHGYRKQSVFWNAIVKYGWDNFTHEIVATGLTEEEAWQLEKALISKYDTTNRYSCRQIPHYNTAGGYTWKFAEVV